MLKEALQFLSALGAPEPVKIEAGDGREFLVTKGSSGDVVKELKPALPDVLSVHTLKGFVTAYVQKFGQSHEDLVGHIVGPHLVQLLGPNTDDWGQRPVLVKAELISITAFPFGKFQDHEDFLIEVLSKFTDAGDRDYLAKIASNITTERVVTSDDDGISQGIGLRKGLSLKTGEVLRNRVQLAPYRTFPEAVQPLTDFLFRVRQSDESTPELALFEADGGAWRYKAIANIESYLKATGQFDIPIIA